MGSRYLPTQNANLKRQRSTLEASQFLEKGDDLVVFVDETGHETFAGDQGFYGLGGCAVLGAGYAHLKERWRAVRKSINGDPDLLLHGSEFERKADNFAILSEFFLDPSFVRIAAPCHRVNRPSSGKCSTPSMMVRK
jgi:hypothetical protein